MTIERGLRIAVIVAAVVLGGLLARRGLQAAATQVTALGPAPDLFHYQAEVVLGPHPSDFDGRRIGVLVDLPRRVVDLACEGDEAALQALGDGIATQMRASDSSTLMDELAGLPDQCFEPPNPSGLCTWAASELERGGELSNAAWAMLTHCPAGVAAPFFDRADAPAERVLAFVEARTVSSPWLRPPPRLPSQYTRAVMELASQPEYVALPDTYVARYDDAAAAEALAQAHDSAPDTASRSFVAQALGHLTNARAQEIVIATCSSIPTLAMCLGTPEREMMELLSDASSYVERHPAERPRVVGQLEACARGTSTELVRPPATCLAALATIDWERARSAASVLGASQDPALAGLAHALTQFPSVNDLTLALGTRHLLGEPRATEAPPVTVASVMASYGRAWMLGHIGLVSFGHDRLARHLLQLGGMPDVEIDEAIASGASGLAALGQATRLSATSRGETVSVTTASDGDYYDLDAIVGLLNVVARMRGANVRYLVVVDPLAEEVIALGPPGELASAVAEGLLEIPSVSAVTPNLPF